MPLPYFKPAQYIYSINEGLNWGIYKLIKATRCVAFYFM